MVNRLETAGAQRARCVVDRLGIELPFDPRGQPGLADPSFFVGGMAYPSGHTANIVLVYGLAVYLAGRYLRLSRRAYALGWVLVVGLSLLMVGVSMTLNWHWFADLVAGLLVGGVVLELSVAADLGYRPTRGPLARLLRR